MLEHLLGMHEALGSIYSNRGLVPFLLIVWWAYNCFGQWQMADRIA